MTVAEGYVGLHIIGKFSNYFQCNSCCRSQQICSIGSVNQPLAMKNIQQVNTKSAWVAALALWFCLCLPSCGPRFESQAHHLRFFQFVLLKLYQENNENKQKDAEIGPFKKRSFRVLAPGEFSLEKTFFWF